MCKLNSQYIQKKKKRNKYIHKKVLCECKDVFCGFKNTKTTQISVSFIHDQIINIDNYNIYSNYIWLKLYCEKNLVSVDKKLDIKNTIFYQKIIKHIYNLLKSKKYNRENMRRVSSKYSLKFFKSKYLQEIKIIQNKKK